MRNRKEKRFNTFVIIYLIIFDGQKDWVINKFMWYLSSLLREYGMIWWDELAMDGSLFALFMMFGSGVEILVNRKFLHLLNYYMGWPSVSFLLFLWNNTSFLSIAVQLNILLQFKPKLLLNYSQCLLALLFCGLLPVIFDEPKMLIWLKDELAIKNILK